MKEFIELEVMIPISPQHPDYKKPDLGNTCFKKSRVFLSLEDCQKVCWENYDYSNVCMINTPLGQMNINMPYEELCILIKQANDRTEEEHNKFHEKLVKSQTLLHDALIEVLKK